jgi:hypothetical protein
MTDRTLSAEQPAAHDGPLALDERSMRVLELGLAGISLLAAILLTTIR